MLNAETRLFSVVSFAATGEKQTGQQQRAPPARKANPNWACVERIKVRRAKMGGATEKQRRSTLCSPNRFTSMLTGIVPATLPKVRAPVIRPIIFSLK